MTWLPTACVATCVALFTATAVRGEYIGGLDGVSNSSVFEVGVTVPLPALGWSNVSGSARIFEAPLGGGTGNGALIGTAPYANYEVQYNMGTPIAPDMIYTLSLRMGFVADKSGGWAAFRCSLGTLNASGQFTPLASAITGTVSYKGNLFYGIFSGSATQRVVTGGSVSGNILAVRWAQTGTAGSPYSDYFGFDNVILHAQPVPEPASLAILSLSAVGLVARVRRRC